MPGTAATDLPRDEALRTITHPTLILARETDPGHPVSSAELLARVPPHLHVSATAADVPTWSDRIGTFLAG